MNASVYKWPGGLRALHQIVALYAFKDQDTFQLELRAQRNF
jgi:hypothetical protein